MARCCRAILAAVLLAGTGCCHWWRCCHCCCDRPPPRLRPDACPPSDRLPEGTLPPVGLRPVTGSYGGTGP